MLKKVITYKDFDGKEQKTVAYFNLNKVECVDMNLEYEEDGGVIGHLKKLLARRVDGQIMRKPTIDFIKLLIERSYGVRPADNPNMFVKEDEDGKPLFRKFKQSAAYEAYVFALLTGEESLEEFAENILPDVSDEQKKEAEKMMKEEGLTDLLTESDSPDLHLM